MTAKFTRTKKAGATKRAHTTHARTRHIAACGNNPLGACPQRLARLCARKTRARAHKTAALTLDARGGGTRASPRVQSTYTRVRHTAARGNTHSDPCPHSSARPQARARTRAHTHTKPPRTTARREGDSVHARARTFRARVHTTLDGVWQNTQSSPRKQATRALRSVRALNKPAHGLIHPRATLIHAHITRNRRERKAHGRVHTFFTLLHEEYWCVPRGYTRASVTYSTNRPHKPTNSNTNHTKKNIRVIFHLIP